MSSKVNNRLRFILTAVALLLVAVGLRAFGGPSQAERNWVRDADSATVENEVEVEVETQQQSTQSILGMNLVQVETVPETATEVFSEPVPLPSSPVVASVDLVADRSEEAFAVEAINDSAQTEESFAQRFEESFALNAAPPSVSFPSTGAGIYPEELPLPESETVSACLLYTSPSPRD